MSIEINNPTRLQALYMAQEAGIELTPEQVDRYVRHRLGIYDHKTREETTIPFNLSDQELLDRELTPEQSSVFKACFPSIFLPRM